MCVSPVYSLLSWVLWTRITCILCTWLGIEPTTFAILEQFAVKQTGALHRYGTTREPYYRSTLLSNLLIFNLFLNFLVAAWNNLWFDCRMGRTPQSYRKPAIFIWRHRLWSLWQLQRWQRRWYSGMFYCFTTSLCYMPKKTKTTKLIFFLTKQRETFKGSQTQQINFEKQLVDFKNLQKKTKNKPSFLKKKGRTLNFFFFFLPYSSFCLIFYVT